MDIEITSTPKIEDDEYVINRLKQFNRQFARADLTKLSLYIRDEDGQIIAGLLGKSHWGLLHIEILWVDEGFRRKGLAGRLIEQACEQARLRRCRFIVVETMEFQAKDFYLKQGFELMTKLVAAEPELNCYYLKKQLL